MQLSVQMNDTDQLRVDYLTYEVSLGLKCLVITASLNYNTATALYDWTVFSNALPCLPECQFRASHLCITLIWVWFRTSQKSGHKDFTQVLEELEGIKCKDMDLFFKVKNSLYLRCAHVLARWNPNCSYTLQKVRSNRYFLDLCTCAALVFTFGQWQDPRKPLYNSHLNKCNV